MQRLHGVGIQGAENSRHACGTMETAPFIHGAGLLALEEEKSLYRSRHDAEACDICKLLLQRLRRT